MAKSRRSDDGGGASDTTEPARGSSSGTDVPLRDYLDDKIAGHAVEAARQIDDLEKRVAQQFELNDKALQAALIAQEKAVAAALTAAKEAVDKAEFAASKRFEATNEFRGQLADQAQTFVRADVAETQWAASKHERDLLRAEIQTLTARVDNSAGQKQGSADQRIVLAWGLAAMVSILSIVGAIIAIARI